MCAHVLFRQRCSSDDEINQIHLEVSKHDCSDGDDDDDDEPNFQHSQGRLCEKASRYPGAN